MTRFRHSLLIAFTIGVAALGLVACDSTLEEDPKTFRNPDNYFQNAAEVQAAASGMYEPLVTFDLYKFGGWAESACTNDITYCGFFGGGMNGQGWENAFWQGNLWVGYYRIIARANTLLQSIGDSPVDEELTDRARGQAYFLRGWSYYSLAIRYGDAPIRSELYEPSSENFGDQGRNPVHEVFQQATSDLRRAANLLPQDYSTGYQRGRPTGPAARGMLAKTYLHMAGEQFTQDNSQEEWFDETLANNEQAYYDSARVAASKVVDQAEGSSFPGLVDGQNITDLYDAETQNKTSEVLFAIQMGSGDNPGFPGGIHPQFYNPSGPLNLDGERVAGGNNIFGAIHFRHRWVQSQEDSDLRFEVGEMLWGGWTWRNNNSLETYVQEAIPDGAVRDTTDAEEADPGTPCRPDSYPILTDDEFQQEFEGVEWAAPFNAVVGDCEKADGTPIIVWPTYYTKKYVNLGATAAANNGTDPLVLRYADVLLVYAEALAETGRMGEAVTQLNKVRERANVSTYTTGDFPLSGDTTLVEAIWAERARELYAEQDRRFDLFRQGRYFDRMEAVGKSRPARRRLYPLPNQEINGNREISTNNPGY